ncbi:AbrB/MazE/SpoVT family DNA-binding domain-containing protein [Dehalogenimonas formicexedens]|uniref:AbrB/MazE/SpoVT family DNA-binding domain-containing protein n=1 Tax=Dehalogenimonas formicexedens TaxID=1839801 RepID=UPI003CCCD837
MPSETKRTVINLGQGSLIICLPKDWLRYHHIRAGDKVRVVTNGVITIEPLIADGRSGNNRGSQGDSAD